MLIPWYPDIRPDIRFNPRGDLKRNLSMCEYTSVEMNKMMPVKQKSNDDFFCKLHFFFLLTF